MRRIALFITASAWLLFVSSYFLTALVTVEAGILSRQDMWKVDLQGWQATLLAFGSLDDLRRTPLLSVVTFMAALSNLVMLWSPWAIFSRNQLGIHVLFWLAPVATLVDIAVYPVWRGEAQFGPGYFAWVASFALLTVGLCLVRFGHAAYSGDANAAGAA